MSPHFLKNHNHQGEDYTEDRGYVCSMRGFSYFELTRNDKSSTVIDIRKKEIENLEFNSPIQDRS